MKEIDLHGLHTHEAVNMVHKMVEHAIRDPFQGEAQRSQIFIVRQGWGKQSSTSNATMSTAGSLELALKAAAVCMLLARV